MYRNKVVKYKHGKPEVIRRRKAIGSDKTADSQLHLSFLGKYSAASLDVALFFYMNKERKKLRYPIRLKAVTMMAVLALVIIEVAVAYYAIMMKKTSNETYSKVAKDISASVALTINVDDVKDLKSEVQTRLASAENKPIAEESSDEELNSYFVANHFDEVESSTVFHRVKDFLVSFVNTNSDFLDCLYVQYVDPSNEFVVYLADSDNTETACRPGYLDPVHDESKSMITSPTSPIEPHVTKLNRYGSLMIAGAPILDGEDVVAYAMADISMEVVRQRRAGSIVRLFIYMLVSLILLGGIGVLWVSLWMIRPLKKLTNVATTYDSDNPKQSHESLQTLNLHGNDEISDLAASVKRMENDSYERFNALLDTNRQLIISREETKKMEILANQDGLTGVHNKIAYNSEVARIHEQIKNGEKVEFAIVMVDLNYLKDTNDSFGHDTGDMVLIKLASLVCDVFKLSPVYRIGGDEFVVVCRGKDYQRVSALVEQFKSRVDHADKSVNHDADHISAAIGYAVYNPKQDQEVDDVFRRADNAMYQNKRQLKNPSKKS